MGFPVDPQPARGIAVRMQVHASCAARDGLGVLLLGGPGAGKSSLAVRLLARGFILVADDRVELDGRLASPPGPLAGLIEVRGLGVIRVPHRAPVPVVLAVLLGAGSERLPQPGCLHAPTGAPQLTLDPANPAVADIVGLALDCVAGRATCVSGALQLP